MRQRAQVATPSGGTIAFDPATHAASASDEEAEAWWDSLNLTEQHSHWERAMAEQSSRRA